MVGTVNFTPTPGLSPAFMLESYSSAAGRLAALKARRVAGPFELYWSAWITQRMPSVLPLAETEGVGPNVPMPTVVRVGLVESRPVPGLNAYALTRSPEPPK